jgi:hypothetical protein
VLLLAFSLFQAQGQREPTRGGRVRAPSAGGISFIDWVTSAKEGIECKVEVAATSSVCTLLAGKGTDRGGGGAQQAPPGGHLSFSSLCFSKKGKEVETAY